MLIVEPCKDTPTGPVHRNFRYKVTPKSKVNCFRPKLVDTDALTARYSQFGGYFKDFDKLPKSKDAAVVWEVRVAEKTIS